MATKDDRPGLLSKVALFVRNPTKDWSELDQPIQQEEAGYDKQVLKAMIERKRQNDFVRRREFDQLRKLRNRDPGAAISLARPSYFQNSVPTDLDGRAVTLKKIDEIEAQMSKQWWKNKTEGAGLGPATQAPPDKATTLPGSLNESAGSPATSVVTDAVGPTLAHAVGGLSDMEFASTQMSGGALPPHVRTRSSESNALAAGLGGSDASFSTSRLFAIEVDEVATDPELEEAAIRFANGDLAGAESGLLEALRVPEVSFAAAQSWVAALLDLYRASNRRVEFEKAVQEFAAPLQGARPVWIDLGSFPATMASPLASSTPVEAALWECPVVLGLDAMEQLRNALATASMPWRLGWAALEQIQPEALPLLDGLFGSLCDENVSAVFSGTECLLQAMRVVTPSGNRQVDQAWWLVRLNILRSLQLQDDFELVALDYCVTYELSPPAWQEARCHIERTGATVAGPLLDPDPPTAPMQYGASDGSCVLSGEILGDATDALAALDDASVPGTQVLIGCSGLLRVDFAAAGSILNWVAMRQAQGRQIQFCNVHRLVAAFFNVIGINEHAKVVPRPI